MNIHECQGKKLLKQYAVTVLEGYAAWTQEEAEAADKLPGPVHVVKSQIHAGGRGAGRFADEPNGKGGARVARSPRSGASRGPRKASLPCRLASSSRPHGESQPSRVGEVSRTGWLGRTL
jgi:hypothetical protein